MNRATRAIIYKQNLIHNISQIKNLVEKNTKICIAVKADSYGHNAILTVFKPFFSLTSKNTHDIIGVLIFPYSVNSLQGERY